jgi:hypothetical protein
MLLSIGCISSRRIEDCTDARANICEVHDLAMKAKLVPQTFGMNRSPWISQLRLARQDIFPHADEMYDTYACLQSYERYARVHVCPECTTARRKWLADHSPPPYDQPYIRNCDALLRQFRQCYSGQGIAGFPLVFPGSGIWPLGMVHENGSR